jgi:hypothetical protein
MWDQLTTRLEGQIVVLEPLEARHEEGSVRGRPAPGDLDVAGAGRREPRVLLRLVRRESIARKHMLMPGVGVRDSAYYSVIDEEWPEVRANLERRLAAGRMR